MRDGFRTADHLTRPPRGRDRADDLKLGTGTIQAVEETVETPEGFALGYPRTDDWRDQLQLFAETFSTRMPLFRAEMIDDPQSEKLWVRITGPAEGKEYLARIIAAAKTDRVATTMRLKTSIAGRATVRAGLMLRRATSSLRVLPDFLIIGAAKCGTTTLYTTLTKHPSIATAARKEIYFFDHAYHRGLGYYRSFFPTRSEKHRIEQVNSAGFRTGEATPCYLFHPHVPRRVFEHIPHAKLIVLVRNPADRAYSEYCMKLRYGYERASFEDAIAREPEMVEGELEKMLADEDYFSHTRWHSSYLGRGMYADQLENWLEYFPRDQILVLPSEDFFKSPAEAYGSVMRHLGLPEWVPDVHPKTNFAPYPDMRADTRRRLLDHFAPHNERLFDLLGRRFDWTT